MKRIASGLVAALLLHMPPPALAASDAPATSAPELPASLAACGTIGWMPRIGVLLDYLLKERGLPATEKLTGETLTRLLPSLDPRLTLATVPGVSGAAPGWRANWNGKPHQNAGAGDQPQGARTDLPAKVYDTLADACSLLREQEAAAKVLNRRRGFAEEFEAAFLQALRDPAAEFGQDATSLSVESKASAPPSESFSAHWIDKQMGIARIYLPDLFYSRDRHFDEGLKALQAEAPVTTLLLDLRNASGGSIKDVYAMLSRFLPQQTPIYQAFNWREQGRMVRLQSATPPDKILDIPILVLVSGKTRGGAEILAGVLQGSGRARIVGEASAGLATHKAIIELGERRALLLTREVLIFPGKTAPQIRIQPDVAVAADAALETALATLAVDGKMPENPFIRHDEKVSPLIRAILADRQDDAARLIEAGADLDVEASPDALERLLPHYRAMERDGSTPLAGYPLAIAAAAIGLPRVLRAIGQRDPQRLQASDINGRTALAYAARSGFLDSTRYLLSQGLDPIKLAKQYPTSNTPLALAVQEKRSEAVALLVAAIPKNSYTQVAVAEQVWAAAFHNDTPTLRALLEAGVPPHYIAPQGGTALISSVTDKNLAQVQLLLQHGATVDQHRYRKRTVFEIAEANLSAETDAAREIHRLIQAAPRTVSTWKKPAAAQQMEDLWKMIEGKKP